MGVSAVQRWDVGREGVTARVEVKLDVVFALPWRGGRGGGMVGNF